RRDPLRRSARSVAGNSNLIDVSSAWRTRTDDRDDPSDCSSRYHGEEAGRLRARRVGEVGLLQLDQGALVGADAARAVPDPRPVRARGAREWHAPAVARKV